MAVGVASWRLDFLDAEEVAQVVEGGQVVRVADDDGQHLVLERQRQHLVDAGHRLGDQRQRFGRRLDFLEVDDLQAELLGEGLEELVFGDEAAADGDLAGQLAGGLGFVEDVPELVVVDEAEVDEDLAERAADRLAASLLLDAAAPFLARRRLA